MNNRRRKTIHTLSEQIDSIRIALEELKETLVNVQDEEQECLDCIPENLQGSERASAAEEAVSNLDEAVYGMDDVIAGLEEIVSNLDAASE